MFENVSFGVKYVQDNTGFPNKSNKLLKPVEYTVSAVISYVGKTYNLSMRNDVFHCLRYSFHNRWEQWKEIKVITVPTKNYTTESE